MEHSVLSLGSLLVLIIFLICNSFWVTTRVIQLFSHELFKSWLIEGIEMGNRCLGHTLKSCLELHFISYHPPPCLCLTHTVTIFQLLTQTKLQFSGFPICSSFTLGWSSIQGWLFLILVMSIYVPFSSFISELTTHKHSLSQCSVQFSFKTHHSGLFLFVC